MTRRDYIALAGAIRSVPSHDPKPLTSAAEAIANVCAENPRFDRERFLKAAGVTR